MRSLPIYICALLIPVVVYSRKPDTDKDEWLARYIEEMADNLPEEHDPAYLAGELETLHMHPVNLNRAGINELNRLFMLNEIQRQKLIEHRERHGRLISIYELQAIDGFDTITINMILPFVTIDQQYPRPRFNLQRILSEGENVLFLRYSRLLEQQKGFLPVKPDESTPYPGSPYRLYARFRHTWYRNISFGFTAEKDPGEEFFRGSQKQGFDFYSAHLFIRDAGRIRALAVGDYLAGFGQGLTLWSGLNFGKGTETIGVRKNQGGLRQYTSVDENNFLRGIGATIGIGRNFEITAFYSNKKRDASITGEENGRIVISSLQQSGLHRTPRELECRKTVRERIKGSNIRYSSAGLSFGLTAYRMVLDAEYRRNLSFYNQFDFSNNHYNGAGLDFSYLKANANIFGEAAMGDNRRMAFIGGIMLSLHSSISVSLVYRNYQRGYQSPLASAFGEGSTPSNESGIYTGAEIRLSPRLRITAFADHFRFPWMRYRAYMPSQGFDYLISLQYQPDRETTVSARFRTKNKPLNTSRDVIIPYPEKNQRTQLRLHFGYPVSDSFSCRTRLEAAYHKRGSDRQRGHMIYHDILYRNASSPLSLTLRYALFDTDGFDSRIYAYEHDVLYAFSFPFYSDKGMRTYILVRYRAGRNTDIYARIARTVYINRDSSGSGLDTVEGKRRTEIKAQVRYRF